MGTSSHDTQPERHVTTDPGLGVTVAERTDPGLAPPSGPVPTLEIIGEASATPPPVGVDRDAATPLPGGDPGRVVPRKVQGGGEQTPVPPEADGLLNGLIASENEAYFRKAKAGAQSSGEAAASFHAAPRAVAPGNPTPPPEAPVLLRRSVELEAADIEALAKVAPVPERRTERDTDPPGAVMRERPPEPTMRLPDPRSPWTEKAIAFGLAMLAVGAIGIIAVRWLGGPDASSTPQPAPTHANPPTATPAAVRPAVAPEPSIPPPPPEVAPAPSVVDTAAAADPASPETTAPRPGARPRGKGLPAEPGTRRAPGQASPGAPGEVVPPAKDDVKRSM
jgi:hypothetical protein